MTSKSRTALTVMLAGSSWLLMSLAPAAAGFGVHALNPQPLPPGIHHSPTRPPVAGGGQYRFYTPGMHAGWPIQPPCGWHQCGW